MNRPWVVPISLFRKIRFLLYDLRDYVHNAWVEILLNGLGFISGILVARYLGPTGRGQLNAAVIWPQSLAILISIGLQHAFAYATGVGWASPERLGRLALRWALLVGIPAMAIYWLLCPLILYEQFSHEMWVPRIFALYIPPVLYAGLLLPIYQGAGDFTRWNIGRVFRNGAWTLWIIASVAIAGLTVLSLLLAQIVIIIVLGIFLFSQLSSLKERTRGGEAAPTGRILKYGLAIYISGLAYTVNQQLDQLLLSVWVVPSELGQYATAAALSAIVLVIPSAVGPIVFSKVARASDERSEQRHHLRLALLWTMMLLVPAGLVLMILAPWLTQILYGSDYATAGQVLRVLAPATIMLGIGITLSDVLRGAGKPVYATYGALTGAVITVVGLAWALPWSGIWGAAWVSLIAYGAMMLVQTFFLWRWLSTPL